MYSLESELGGVSAKSRATQRRYKIENFVWLNRTYTAAGEGDSTWIRKKKV